MTRPQKSFWPSVFYEKNRNVGLKIFVTVSGLNYLSLAMSDRLTPFDIDSFIEKLEFSLDRKQTIINNLDASLDAARSAEIQDYVNKIVNHINKNHCPCGDE